MAGVTTNTGFENDWQASKSVIERNWYMLNNSISTDVTFSVGNEPRNDDGRFFVHFDFDKTYKNTAHERTSV